MKITRSDSEHLIVVDFPIFGSIWFLFPIFIGLSLLVPEIRGFDFNFGKLLVGCIFLAGGVWAQFSLLNRTVFDFNLRARQVKWEQAGLLGRKGGQLAFDDILFAYVEYSGGKGMNLRPVLQLRVGVLPVRPYSTYDRSQEVCNEINKALGKPPRTMEEDVAVTARSLLSRGKLDAAVSVVRKMRHFNPVEIQTYLDSLKATIP